VPGGVISSGGLLFVATGSRAARQVGTEYPLPQEWLAPAVRKRAACDLMVAIVRQTWAALGAGVERGGSPRFHVNQP
jgi:hypothetical protein